MSDVNANIGVQIDTSSALAELKNLQRQLANFHASIAKTSAAATAAQKGLQTNLLNSINATGQFTATMGNVRSSTESFTHALESNKLSMREYFRYAGGASKTFGRLFKQEFDTIGKVAEERVKKMQTQYIKMGRDANGAIKAMAITPQTLNMNDYATKTALAAQKQALFNQVVRQGSTSLLNFGKNTQWAGRQLMVGFTIPLAYFGTTASKVFMDLEAQAIRFKRVYGDIFTTAEDTNKALADVQALAEGFTKYGVAVSKTMEMAASAAAMGKTGADLTAQVSEATRLAVLGGVEQEQALETTISLTNAFGIAAEDLAQKINFLNSVENQTVVSIEDLTIAIPKAGPVVQQLGGDVEDLAFFLTAMKEGGINASEGANALKSGLASLINPSKKASGMLADLGVNIKGIVEANKGDIRNTVIGFAQALDTLAPLDRSRAIEQLFGKFQFARLSTLFQNITKEGTQASKVLQLAGASIEELAILSERELKTVEDAVGTQFKSAVEELKLAIAPIGKTFLQAVTPIVKVIGDLLDKFNNLGDGTKKFIVIASTLVGIIGPTLLMTFGLVANGVANIIKLFLALRGGFLRLGGNSKILAEQTNYLNAEQLESATVAASLNQAHTRLTQSFTAEASAVKALRAAYVEATVAGANFARSNPGMMMPGRVGKGPKKFADGTTGLPGPKGAGDIIPILGAPGEAIIPAKVAQDDRFKPIIDAMVNGNLQGYEEGTVRLGGKSFKTKSQQTARDLETTISQLMSEGMSEEKIVAALERNVERGRSMNASQLKRRLSIGRGSSSGSSAPSSIRALAKQSQSGFLQETEAVKKALKDQGVVLTPAQEKNLFNVQASHIEEARNGGVKEWKANNLVADLGYVNNYINTVKGKLGTDLLKMSDAKLQELGIDRKELQKLQSGTHPTTADAAKTLRAVAQYDSIRNPGSYQAKAVVAGLEHRSKTNFYAQPLKTLAETQPISSRVEKAIKSRADLVAQEQNAKAGNDSQQLMKQIDKDIRKTALEKQAPTNFGTQISPTTGHSFPVKGLGGIYQKPDGTRVFVKPVMDAKAALAEQRATTIARDVHGLDSPKQEIRTMADPTDPTGKRKLIVLESAFDSKFDPNKMTNKFTKDEYFKQLVAANLRGDKDLGRGNLSGNVLADVGTAGVFEKASGKRDFAKTMPSMAEQAKINLLGVKGGAKKFFAESTLDVPKGMTADQYHNNMIKEIDRVLPKLKSTIAKFDLNPAEKEAYSGMIARLEEGKKVNWREFHKIHSSVLATKKEALQDKKTGEITSIKGKAKPNNVIASTGKASDRVMTQVPPGKRIVQKPRGFISSRFGSKTVLPGYADAPEVTGVSVKNISQSQRLSRAQLLAATEKISLKQAKKRIAAESKLTTSMEESTAAQRTTKEKLTNFSNKAGLGVGAMSGLTIAASFAGGSLGEMAQKIMPFVFGLQGIIALLPMLANPWVAAAAALIGVGIALKTLSDKSKKMGAAQSKYIDQISATTEKMKSVGQLTGKVGASEIMARRREGGTSNEYLTEFDRAGQQFGTNFLSSEVGKSILESFKTNIVSGGSDAMRTLSLELSSYVSDGLMTAEDANSVARSIGINMSDMTITANIQGQLREILGPDGKDLATNPLIVRLKIAEESQKSAKDYAEQNIDYLEEANKISAKGIARSFSPILAYRDLSKMFSESGKLAGGAAASSVQSLEIVQAQRDAQSKLYDDQIRTLEAQRVATTDKVKQVAIETQIANLKTQQASDDAKLAEKGKETLKTQIEIFNTLAKAGKMGKFSANETAYISALDQQVSDKYKDDPIAKVFLGNAANTESKTLEVTLKTMVGAGNLTPLAGTKILEMFGKDGEAKLESLLTTTLALKDPGKVQELINIATSLGGKVGLNLITKISAEGQESNFDSRLKALTLLQTLDGKEINLAAYLKTDAIGKLDKLVPLLDKVEKIKTPITKTVLQEFLTTNPDTSLAGLIADWDKYAKLPAELQKTAIQTYIAIYKTITDENAAEMAKEEAKSRGLRGRSAGDFIKKNSTAASLAATLNRKLYADTVTPPKVPGSDSGGGTGKSRNTTFDSILQDLKNTRDATIDAQGGAKELMRILGSKKDLQLFNGLDQQLSKLGANSDFIDFVGGLENAVKEKIIKINKQGVVSYGEFGEAAKKAYDEKQLGAFSSKSAIAIKELQGQRSGFVALKAAGVESADAVEMLADATFAASLAAQKNPEEVKRMIAEWKIMKNELNLTTAAINPQQYFDDQMAIANKQFSYQEAIARRTYEPQIAATEELVKANNILIDQAQRKLEMDATYGSRQIDKINSEIEGLNRQLAQGIDATLQTLSVESAKLSEDQATIAKTVDSINEKYDLQEKALSKISELNQDIIAEKKTQISLADALTQGDISAAAQAVQDVRSASSDRAQQLASDAMTAARESQIAGVTGSLTGMTGTKITDRQYQIDRETYKLGIQRAGIEAQIAAKQEEIYKIDLLRKPIIAEITRLEDLNYNYANNILPAIKTKLDNELSSIQAQRDKWSDAQLAIDGATVKGEAFRLKLKAADTLVDSISGLWNKLNDKNLKITIDTINRVINESGASGSGTATITDTNGIQHLVYTSGPKAGTDVNTGEMVKQDNSTISAAALEADKKAQAAATAKAAADAIAKQKAAEAAAIAKANKVAKSSFTYGSGNPFFGLSSGGMVPKYFAAGGLSRGTDTIPAMLTPGEFVINKNAADGLGINNLNKLNSGESLGSSVYNYSVGINVTNANADANDIARAVMGQIKYIDSQRIRGQR
jgi:TP901 family phage tail tape measure protein